MKSFLTFLLLSLFVFPSFAQKCDGFYLMQDGKTVTITNYGRKDKVSGTVTYTISDVNKSKTGLTAKVRSQIRDDKNEVVTTSDTKVECSGGQYNVDLRMMMTQQQLKQVNKYDADIDFFIEYPDNMKVGDVLKDAVFILEAKSDEGLNPDLEMKIEERTVLAQEKVTTPAGTWDCFRIKAHVTLKTTVSGISIPFSTDNMEWFAPGFGVVKTETKSGRSELTSIK